MMWWQWCQLDHMQTSTPAGLQDANSHHIRPYAMPPPPIQTAHWASPAHAGREPSRGCSESTRTSRK